MTEVHFVASLIISSKMIVKDAIYHRSLSVLCLSVSHWNARLVLSEVSKSSNLLFCAIAGEHNRDGEVHFLFLVSVMNDV
jgi:hypothetical protein